MRLSVSKPLPSFLSVAHALRYERAKAHGVPMVLDIGWLRLIARRIRERHADVADKPLPPEIRKLLDELAFRHCKSRK